MNNCVRYIVNLYIVLTVNSLKKKSLNSKIILFEFQQQSKTLPLFSFLSTPIVPIKVKSNRMEQYYIFLF